jgi:hypothetical protein
MAMDSAVQPFEMAKLKRSRSLGGAGCMAERSFFLGMEFHCFPDVCK